MYSINYTLFYSSAGEGKASFEHVISFPGHIPFNKSTLHCYKILEKATVLEKLVHVYHRGR